MRKIILVSLFFLFAITAKAVTLDAYGGRTDVACSTTGKWSTQRITNHWWICTPAGHGFNNINVQYVISQTTTSDSVLISKYGNTTAWSEYQLKQLQAWGFNVIGLYSHDVLWAVQTDSSWPGPNHTHSILFPFIAELRASFYSMKNPSVSKWGGGSEVILSDAVKDLWGAYSPYYGDYIYAGLGDYFDTKMTTWATTDLSIDYQWGLINNGPTGTPAYLMAIAGDDGDEMTGFNTGADFPTVPVGNNNPYLPLLVATMSPVQTAENRNWNWVYTDTLMHLKAHFISDLITEYGTIGALNAAWKSSYSTFNSSGKCVGTQPITCATSASADSVGTGNGSTLTFSTTLTYATIDCHSLQILVTGAPVGGDSGTNPGCGSTGSIYGPNLSGTINYSTKALSITFTSGNAPANLAAITATYITNGWGNGGTGLLDEDMRSADRAWLGNAWNLLASDTIGGGALVPMNTTVKTDLDAVLLHEANWYFGMMNTAIKTAFPNVLFDTGISSWSGMPPIPVLQALGTYIDIEEMDDTAQNLDTTRLNWLHNYYGDKPILIDTFYDANPDSALAAYPGAGDGGDFSTQPLRGTGYYNVVHFGFTGANSSGIVPSVGASVWEFMDQYQGMNVNYGLVTQYWNAYDAYEAAAGTLPCAPPIANLSCGNDPAPGGSAVRPYGNFINQVINANSIWLGGPPPPASPTSLSNAIIAALASERQKHY